jgi:predicted component of type VI protein secretion system
MKFDLHAALTNIGRGEHNDIAIRDESISDSHAKLQKRADGWWIVDQGSTNGTYVGGRRVQGEQKLEGAPDIRFGGIKMTFRPSQAPEAAGGSTKAIAAADVAAMRRSVAAAKTPAIAKQAPAPAEPETKKKGCGAVIAIFLTLAGTGAGLLTLLLVAGR